MNCANKKNPIDMVKRVTGALKYVGDFSGAESLHAKCVRINIGHAKIDAINTDAALAVEGVEAVYTASDLPSPMVRFGPLVQDQPLLAQNEITFAGQPVAVVLAQTQQAAEKAAAAVKVTYSTLPAVTTIEQALAPDAPLVQHPELRGNSKWRDTNIMGEWNFAWGDVNGTADQCSLLVENTYRTPFIHHYALEPYCVQVVPDSDGVTLYASIQHPFILRRIIAHLLNLPIAKVRIVSLEMGGGFGGRGYPKIEPLAAQLAWLVGRSVKMSLTADEGFFLAQREASRIWMRTGFDETGRILVHEVISDILIGAYTDISPRVAQKAGFLGAGPYAVPNVAIKARGIFSHTAPTTAFRGFGATHMAFALESQMNEAAQQLEIDPVRIRFINLPEKGQQLVPNDNPADGDWKAVLKKAADSIGWDQPKPEKKGRGIAIGIKSSVPATYSSAKVRLNLDGSVSAYVGTTEMGQGARMVMARFVSESLAVPIDRVRVVSGDTGRVPFDAITASSRSTVMMGQALISACEDVKSQLYRIATELYGPLEGELQMIENEILINADRYPLSDLFHEYFGPGSGEIVGIGRYRGEKDKHHPLGGPAAFWEVIITAVELSIDGETGEIFLHKLVNVSDAGKIINPLRAIGQDEGGTVMAIGAALMEQILMDADGALLNAGSLDYKVPTIADIPEKMTTVFQENEDGPGPHGSKGIGESGIIATLPAICGAILDASGLSIREIPITSERVWRMLKDKQKTLKHSEED